MTKWGWDFLTPLFFTHLKLKIIMRKINVFLLIIAFSLLCIVGFHLAVVMVKVIIGAVVIGIIALGFYIGRETSKHR